MKEWLSWEQTSTLNGPILCDNSESYVQEKKQKEEPGRGALVAKATEERAEQKVKWQMLPGNRLEAGLQGCFKGSAQRLDLWASR